MSAAAEIRLQHVETKGLRFRVAGCGEGDRLVLCLHGFPECWYSWRDQLPLFARLGYRAWAPDLRGYGETDRPPQMRDYALEKLMQDVADLIDASGARSTILVAHDWGGLVAWYFAMRQLRPLDGLVVMNLPHPGAAQPAFRHWKQRRRSWYAAFFQIPWLPEKLLGMGKCRGIGRAFQRTCVNRDRFSDEVVSVYQREAARPGALKAMIDYYRALVRGGGANRQRALGHPLIDTRTLMLWGEEDVALTKETTYGTEAFVPNLTLRYLPNASHWVQQDAPETVNTMLEAWLTNEPVPESPEHPR